MDVGCGLGEGVRQLAALLPGTYCVGVDTDAFLLGRAREASSKQSRVAFLHGDATALLFPDACFDGCRADRVLQHIADVPAALDEVRRVLVAGGRIVVTDTDWSTLIVNADAPEAGVASDLSRAHREDRSSAGWSRFARFVPASRLHQPVRFGVYPDFRGPCACRCNRRHQDCCARCGGAGWRRSRSRSGLVALARAEGSFAESSSAP